MKFIIFSLIFLYVQSQGPMWAEEFQVAFNETMKEGLISQHTSGVIYYDWVNRQYRIDRENGRGDRYCGSTHLKNTPCRHYVSEGKRYLHFPNLGQCCHCCDDENGCGVLRPDWAEDAEFVENTVDATGRTVEKWDKKGLQSNYIYQTTDTKINTQIDQVPNDFLYFDLNTYKIQVDDPSVFDLPEVCNQSKDCAGLSICQRVRQQSKNNELE